MFKIRGEELDPEFRATMKDRRGRCEVCGKVLSFNEWKQGSGLCSRCAREVEYF